MKKNKELALDLLKQKEEGKKITYEEISCRTGYGKRQLIRLKKLLKKEDRASLMIHGLTNNVSNHSASKEEIEYIKNFKKLYPVISISQFMDIYHEDVIWNEEKIEDVIKNKLRVRSKSFFNNLFKINHWKSPIKHKCFVGEKSNHPLRDPSPRRGILIMTDGTPHDWFQNGVKWSLHMVIDDATGEILAGWFMPTECQYGYCMAFKIMFEKYGIPQIIYADRTSILWDSKEGNETQTARMLRELGIELIYANSPEAKGKIERMNETIQNRLLNDIIRFKIKTYPELNKWFNDFYIDYINKKYAYEPADNSCTEFIPLDNFDLSKIMCLKVNRKILNGNMISYKNNYYVPLNDDDTDCILYKGTEVQIWDDIFTHKVRIFHKNKIYKTRKIKGHYKNLDKIEQKRIDDQKTLDRLIKERDERLKNRKHTGLIK